MDEQTAKKRVTEVMEKAGYREGRFGSRIEWQRLRDQLVSLIMEAQGLKGPAKVPSRFGGGTAHPAKKATEMPEELEHALECDEEHEFIQDCLRQWEEKQWLSGKQRAALAAWRPKGEYED